MTQKIGEKIRNSMFLSAGCCLLRCEGFFSSLDVLYGGLEIGKLHFLIKKILFFFSCYFLLIFGLVFSIKCWIWIRIKLIRIRNIDIKRGKRIENSCSAVSETDKCNNILTASPPAPGQVYSFQFSDKRGKYEMQSIN